MSSAPIVPPAGEDSDAYGDGCVRQWAIEDSVINGVTAQNGRPRSQRIRVRRQAKVMGPKHWAHNRDAEDIAAAELWLRSMS